MVTYSEWFDPPAPKRDIPVRFHRGQVGGATWGSDIQIDSEGKPAAYPTELPILSSAYDADVEEVADQYFVAAGRFIFEDRGEGPKWYRTGYNEVHWGLAVCYRFSPEERTRFVPPDPPPPGATGWQLEDLEGAENLEWRVEGEAMWRIPSDAVTHRVVAADPELTTYGPPFLTGARLPLSYPVGQDAGEHKLWGQGPTIFQFTTAMHNGLEYYPFTYTFPDRIPIEVMIGPHITDPFPTSTGNFTYEMWVRNLRFYVDVTYGSRWRWIFGERGTWNMRQRQTLPGSDSWPLRQRQNAGHTGTWAIRQRQTGV